MRLIFPNFSHVVILIGLFIQCAHVNSFSLSNFRNALFKTRGSSDKRSHQQLSMSATPDRQDLTGTVVSKELTGKVIAQRYIYRVSPEESAIQTPYAIEERQYYTVANDRSLQPFGEKRVIFRGPAQTYNQFGPPLYSIEGLVDEKTNWDCSYAMVLYCMQYPDIFNGNGLQVGT